MKYLVISITLFSLSAIAIPPQAASCIACHGKDGNPPGSYYPILAGKDSDFLFKQLKKFQNREIKDATIMNDMIVMVPTDKDKRVVADYFSKQKCKKRCNEKPKNSKDL